MTTTERGVPAGSSDLAGRAVTITNESRSVISFEFGDEALRWRYRAADDDDHGDEGGNHPYRAFRLDDDLYLATFHAAARPTDAVCVVFDFRSGRTFSVVTVLDAADASARTASCYVEFGTIDGADVTGGSPVEQDSGWQLRPGIHASIESATDTPAASVVYTDRRATSARTVRVDFGLPADVLSPTQTIQIL